MSIGGRSSWVAIAAIVIAVVAVIVIVVALWRALGDVEISVAGWLAMGFGVLLALGLGVGLMALVFISNRRGYDDSSGDYR